MGKIRTYFEPIMLMLIAYFFLIMPPLNSCGGNDDYDYSPTSTTAIGVRSSIQTKTKAIPYTPSPSPARTNTTRLTNTKPSCTSWSKISLSNVGQEICATGDVYRTWFDENQDAFFITFTNQDQAFYLVMYGNQIEGLQNTCIQAKGEILKLGNDPIMVIDPHQISQCGSAISPHHTLVPKPPATSTVMVNHPTTIPKTQPVTGSCPCSSNSLNCGNFNSWYAAQECYEFCISQGRGDIHVLDMDNDGIACEGLR
ncbi:MAG: excalibur calcium-binding domain-containing protein [Anaerolineaceae bacterium]|nr:excalibur calcium-binding domain-containing protein [Anaerolineaceae bacterium]